MKIWLNEIMIIAKKLTLHDLKFRGQRTFLIKQNNMKAFTRKFSPSRIITGKMSGTIDD